MKRNLRYFWPTQLYPPHSIWRHYRQIWWTLGPPISWWSFQDHPHLFISSSGKGPFCRHCSRILVPPSTTWILICMHLWEVLLLFEVIFWWGCEELSSSQEVLCQGVCFWCGCRGRHRNHRLSRTSGGRRMLFLSRRFSSCEFFA